MNASGESMIEIDNLTGSNGNDAKTDDKKSIHEWVEVNVDEAVPTRAGGLHKQGAIETSQAKSLVGTYQVVCGVVKEVKAFSKGTYLNFEYPSPNTTFRAVV